MEQYGEKAKAFLRQKTTEEVIIRYLATQKIKGTKYEETYRMRILNYEKIYELLDPKLRTECEAKIKKDIEEGKIDLDSYLKNLNITKSSGEER